MRDALTCFSIHKKTRAKSRLMYAIESVLLFGYTSEDTDYYVLEMERNGVRYQSRPMRRRRSVTKLMNEISSDRASYSHVDFMKRYNLTLIP